ncbi:hypothetical protein CPB85DRAFT_525911 [Mucidula mucida]|nr:hypothetical protein CPB85DRAFT_525911 [Mucidula mucida]
MDEKTASTSDLRRKMTYRKPAPEFVPSPPASPVVQEPSDVPVTSEQMPPPLPERWRDTIEHAISIHTIDLDGVNSKSSFYTAEQSTLYDNQISLLSRGSVSSESPSAFSQRSPSRGPRKQYQYRPPTPPIPAARRKERLDEDAATFVTVDRPVRELKDSGYPILSGQPSFMTEKSQSSYGLTSTFYSGAYPSEVADEGGCARGEHDVSTILPMYIVQRPVAKKRQRQNCSSFWARVSNWFRCTH